MSVETPMDRRPFPFSDRECGEPPPAGRWRMEAEMLR